MRNSFFVTANNKRSIASRIKQLSEGKVGFYSVGLYPASLAYNSAMQSDGSRLLLAPREGRKLLGAFTMGSLQEMDSKHINKMKEMATHTEKGEIILNNLEYLLMNCEVVLLSSNSNYVENDLKQACKLRQKLNRQNVVIGCLVGSFCHDQSSAKSYLLCQKEPNLAFFSGFHRHSALRNPLDSFTANFCHPDALTALLGAQLIDKISPNIQVIPGIHNVEGQYIKAAKNISSIFAGFAHTYHKDNPGLLPSLLTLLLDQCLDQAATVAMSIKDRKRLYSDQLFPITELGYGVQLIEAALVRNGDMHQVRDHTFSQLTAMVADVKGSMMLPQAGQPTRNFQVGQIMAKKIIELKRCPLDISELIHWCESFELKRGGLEGITSLQYWPEILRDYSIPVQDSSMINLLYFSIFGDNIQKELAYKILTNSRELTSFCRESVKPEGEQKFSKVLDLALKNKTNSEALDLIVSSIEENNIDSFKFEQLIVNTNISNEDNLPPSLKLIELIKKDLI